ncbi:unnamed protein product, partial [Prorocentrum cordatum]
ACCAMFYAPSDSVGLLLPDLPATHGYADEMARHVDAILHFHMGFNETLRETYITQILRATKAQCITTSPPTKWPRTLNRDFIAGWIAAHGDNWESTLTSGLQVWQPRKEHRQGLTTITLEDWGIALGVSFKGYRQDLRPQYVQQILDAARALPRSSTPHDTRRTKWPRILTADFISTWIADQGESWETTLESGLQAWSPAKKQRHGSFDITIEDWCVALGVSFKGHRQALRPQYVQQILDAARALPRNSTADDTRRTKWPRILTADFISTWIADQGDSWETILETGLQAWSPAKKQRHGSFDIAIEEWCIALGVPFKGYRQALRPQYVQQILDAARVLSDSSTADHIRRTKWPRILTADFSSTWIADQGESWETTLESGLQAWTPARKQRYGSFDITIEDWCIALGVSFKGHRQPAKKQRGSDDITIEEWCAALLIPFKGFRNDLRPQYIDRILHATCTLRAEPHWPDDLDATFIKQWARQNPQEWEHRLREWLPTWNLRTTRTAAPITVTAWCVALCIPVGHDQLSAALLPEYTEKTIHHVNMPLRIPTWDLPLRTAAVVQWAKQHPDEWPPILQLSLDTCGVHSPSSDATLEPTLETWCSAYDIDSTDLHKRRRQRAKQIVADTELYVTLPITADDLHALCTCNYDTVHQEAAKSALRLSPASGRDSPRPGSETNIGSTRFSTAKFSSEPSSPKRKSSNGNDTSGATSGLKRPSAIPTFLPAFFVTRALDIRSLAYLSVAPPSHATFVAMAATRRRGSGLNEHLPEVHCSVDGLDALRLEEEYRKRVYGTSVVHPWATDSDGTAWRWILDSTTIPVSTDGGPGLQPDNTLRPYSDGSFPSIPTCLSCRLDLSKNTPLLPRCALANDNLILREPVAFRKHGAKLSPMTFAMLALARMLVREIIAEKTKKADPRTKQKGLRGNSICFPQAHARELVTQALPAEPEVSQQFSADGLSIALAGASVDDLDKATWAEVPREAYMTAVRFCVAHSEAYHALDIDEDEAARRLQEAGHSCAEVLQQATSIQATTHTPHLIPGPATFDAPEVPVPESIVAEDGRPMEDPSASTTPNITHDTVPPPENRRPMSQGTADDLCPDSDDVNLHCAATDFSTGALDADRAACEFAAKLELLSSKLSTDVPTADIATEIESLQSLAKYLNTDEYRKQLDRALKAMDAAEGRGPAARQNPGSTWVIPTGKRPLSMYEKEFWQKAFPQLFPYGDGVFGIDRRRPLSCQQWCRMLLLRTELRYQVHAASPHECPLLKRGALPCAQCTRGAAPFVPPAQPRWGADVDFLCVLHDSWRRMELTRRAGAHVRRRGFQTSVNLVCQATATQLRSAFDSMGDRAGFRECLLSDNAPASLREAVRNLLFFSSDVVGSEGARQQLRHEQMGDMLRFGGIGGFLAPNVADTRNPLVVVLHAGCLNHTSGGLNDDGATERWQRGDKFDGDLEGDRKDLTKRRLLVPPAPAFVDHHVRRHPATQIDANTGDESNPVTAAPAPASARYENNLGVATFRNGTSFDSAGGSDDDRDDITHPSRTILVTGFPDSWLRPDTAASLPDRINNLFMNFGALGSLPVLRPGPPLHATVAFKHAAIAALAARKIDGVDTRTNKEIQRCGGRAAASYQRFHVHLLPSSGKSAPRPMEPVEIARPMPEYHQTQPRTAGPHPGPTLDEAQRDMLSRSTR